MSDTITLELQGSVSLEQFAEAVGHFHALIAALSVESDAPDVRWEIDALTASSAIATVRGVSQNGTEPGRIEQVVRNYLEVGQALERGETVPYSNKVRKEANGLAGMLRSGVEGVRFDTAEGEVTLRELPHAALSVAVAAPVSGTYGAVTGRVQTLSSRSHLRFTLYDRLYERAVSCYVAEGRESLMREIWDKVATVEGWVTRDPTSGRPLAVRRITDVTVLTEVGPQAYKNARGVLPRRPGDPPPEEAIRRIRDSG
jgi:hypothetical protein